MTRAAPSSPSRRAWRGLDGFERLIAVGALAKIAASLVLVVTSPAFVLTGSVSGFVRLAHVVAFGAAAVFLTTSGALDRRAFHLGGFFLLVAVSFANGLILWLDQLHGVRSQVRHALVAFHPDAFLPYFLWQFVRQFPRLVRFDRGQALERAFVRAAVAVGLVCAVASAVAAFGPAPAILDPFVWGGGDSWFDALIFGLALPALPFGVWKARRADVRERRRYRLFVAGLAVGFLPIAAQVLAEAVSPAFNAFMDVPPRRALVGYVVLYPLLLSIPVTTTYAVVVHRVMDVKVLVRTAVQYALARVTIVALAAVPAVFLVVSIVRNRNLTVGDLFAASNAPSVLLPLGLLLVALTTRRTLLDQIDRWFFREAVDARALLDALATSTVGSQDTLEAMCHAFSERVQTTFHLAQAEVLVADRTGRALLSVGHRLRPLPLDSALASALADRRDPLVIELDLLASGFGTCPLVSSSGSPTPTCTCSCRSCLAAAWWGRWRSEKS